MNARQSACDRRAVNRQLPGKAGTLLYIFTALRAEADPLAKALHLKRKSSSPFSGYEDEDGKVRLIVTGTGPVRAAAAAGAVLGNLARSELAGTALLNFGSCAMVRGRSRSGCLFRINKIGNLDTGRVWYPDLLIKSSLPEAEIWSGGRIYAAGETEQRNGGQLYAADGREHQSGGRIYAAEETEHQSGGQLYAADGTEHQNSMRQDYPEPVLRDMEAASIYEAGNLFLGPHQMHFLKFVTDMGDPDTVTRESLTHAAEAAAQPVRAYLKTLLDFLAYSEKGRQGEEAAAVYAAALADGFCASAAMQARLTQLLRYAMAAEIDWKRFIDSLKGAGKFPASDRRAGKKMLGAFERQMLEK